MQAWYIWYFITNIFFGGEIFTPGFILTRFGGRCIASTLVVFFKFNFQIITFSIIALSVFFILRPLILQYFFKSTDNIIKNIEFLPGKINRASVKINAFQHSAWIIFKNENWYAIFVDESIIDIDDKVEVLKVNNSKIIFKS